MLSIELININRTNYNCLKPWILFSPNKGLGIVLLGVRVKEEGQWLTQAPWCAVVGWRPVDGGLTEPLLVLGWRACDAGEFSQLCKVLQPVQGSA